MKDLSLMVCPHDTVRYPEGWHRLAQYLSLRLNRPIRLAPSSDFIEFHQDIIGADLVYANPVDSLNLLDDHGFCLLAHPADTYDEALLIAGPDGSLPAIEAIHGAAVASVKPLISTRLALKLLRDRGIIPASLMHRDSWLSVVRSVWNGEVPFGIIHRDAYEALSPQGREMVRILDTTNARLAYHMFCARPSICAALPTLTKLLTVMDADPEGRLVLDGLHIPGWLPVIDAELVHLRALMA
ncbi:MAG: PhnD/SsuA/transferrin family substrate-binding protein [Chloroflexales bacterium]